MVGQVDKGLNCPITVSYVIGALVGTLCPQIPNVLVYQRSLILTGEVWRLFSCHLIHFSTLHLISDLLCFGVAGVLIERRAYPRFGFLCLSIIAISGPACFLFLPGMEFYGGLSALAMGAVTYLCLCSIRKEFGQCWGYYLILLLTGVKIILEIITRETLFFSGTNAPVVPIPLSHLIGVGVAWLFFGAWKRSMHRSF